LALVAQLVLSFGHVHPLPSEVTAIAAPAGSTSPDLPATGDDCAICANIAAFASLHLPQQADLVPPTSVAEILAPVSAVSEHRAAPLLHFSSRAPPSV
jgi:hypothetical protein